MDAAVFVGVADVFALFFCRNVLLTLTELNRLGGAWAVAEDEAKAADAVWAVEVGAALGLTVGSGYLSTASKADACAGGETG